MLWIDGKGCSLNISSILKKLIFTATHMHHWAPKKIKNIKNYSFQLLATIINTLSDFLMVLPSWIFPSTYFRLHKMCDNTSRMRYKIVHDEYQIVRKTPVCWLTCLGLPLLFSKSPELVFSNCIFLTLFLSECTGNSGSLWYSNELFSQNCTSWITRWQIHVTSLSYVVHFLYVSKNNCFIFQNGLL